MHTNLTGINIMINVFANVCFDMRLWCFECSFENVCIQLSSSTMYLFNAMSASYAIFMAKANKNIHKQVYKYKNTSTVCVSRWKKLSTAPGQRHRVHCSMSSKCVTVVQRWWFLRSGLHFILLKVIMYTLKNKCALKFLHSDAIK